MNKEILDQAYILKDSLKNNPDIILLNELESKMSNSSEVMKLCYKKDMLADEYSDLLKIYKEEDDVVVNKRKELISSKDELYAHPLVKEYLKQFYKVQEMYEDINSLLFKDFNMNLCKKN